MLRGPGRGGSKKGAPLTQRFGRAVARQAVVARKEQVPARGSREEKILNETYRYYDGRKARFEAVGSFVAARE